MARAAAAEAGPGGSRPRVFVALPPHPEEGPEAEAGWAVAGEVLVRFRAEAVRRVRQAGLAPWGPIRWLTPTRGRALAGGPGNGGAVVDDLAVVRLPPGMDLARGLDELGGRAEVAYAEPNLRLSLAGPVATGEDSIPAPSDFEFDRQWALHNTGQTGGRPGADIKALEAWSVTTGSPGITVAIIDTGIDYFHPDLEPNTWVNAGEVPGNGVDDDRNGYVDDLHGFDFVSDDGDPTDDNLHGTHVAGILGAVGNDENGIAGVAWSVRLMALKAFDEVGSGTLDDTLSAIGYALANGARIINASWGTTTRSRALDEVVADAVRGGVVFVAAAGNNGNEARFFPAAVPEAIAVGATDASDRSPTFSNHGAFVDLVAPGDAIESTAPNALWTTLSGTSMAAPHVSGLVALMLSVNPAFDPAQVLTILRSTADEVASDRFTGAGRVHAARAVRVREPLPDARLSVAAEWSGRLDVRGVAAGNGFAGFRVELGEGPRPTQWKLLAEGGNPVSDGVLVADFDSAAFDDGDYTLRLTVTNGQGQAAVERAPVTIRNVRLQGPSNNDIVRAGQWIDVRGTVAGTGWTHEVAWGVGREPAVWHTNGIEVVSAHGQPVVQGLLARWDSGVGPTNDFVTLRLAARREGRVVGEALARMVHLEPRLRPGWPRHLRFDDEFPVASWREFNVADLEGDGTLEIILVDHGEPGGRPPRLMVLDPSGTTRWSRDLPAGAPEFDAPVVGDLDGDGRQEILVDTGSSGLISAFDAEGRPWGGGWPVAPGGTHFGKLLADLDGDGRPELVAVSNPPPDLVGNRQRFLLVIGADGVVRHRWTLGTCDTEINVPEQLAAVANLDDDPELELVAVDGCQGISAFDPGQPSGPLWTALTESTLVASPVVGDLEGDGREEVIIGGVSRGKGLPGGLHVFDHRGRPRQGWPVLVEESFQAGAALADLDGDGVLDIVIPAWDSQTVHVVRADGFELDGWPVRTQANAATRSIPVVGDVDGDGWPDVVLPSPGFWLPLVLSGETARAGGVRAWRYDGSLIDFHPAGPPDGLILESAAGATWHRLPPAVLVDLDGNGRLDVVAGSVQDRAYSPTAPLVTAKMRSSLYAWELPVPVSEKAIPWPAFQGGPSRTGRLYRPPPPNQPPVIGEIPSQKIGVGSSFRPIPLDRYVEDPDGASDRLVWSVRGERDLRVTFDPRRVASIVAPTADWEGREEIEFLVRDAREGEASVRVVFAAVRGYRPPVAETDAAETVEEEWVLVDVLANDHSPEDRPLRVAGVSRPGAGRTELRPDGRIGYLPATDFFGEDGFEYTLADNDGGFATGEVRIRVVGVNDPPVAETDRLILDEDTPGDLEPLANDRDPDGDALELTGIAAPVQGRLEDLGQGRFRFVPPPDYFGVQSFAYTIRDPGGLTATGEVAVLVKPVNDPPVLRDQTLTLNRNRSADVFYDAVDADGDVLTFSVVEGPTNGVLLAYPSLANYEPQSGFVGVDRFTYTASDGLTGVGPAVVTLRVVDANNPPDVESVSTVTAQDQTLVIPLRVRDADGEAVILRLDRPPAHGTARIDGTNAVYTPEPAFVGTDSFSYRASDGQEESPEALVTVRVTDQNTAPRAQSEVLTVGRNRSTPVTLRATDAENNPLRFQVVTNPAYGVLEGTPPALVYTPRLNFGGLDRLFFTAADRVVTSEVAVVHLLVREPNTVPTVTNQTVVLRRDQSLVLRLPARDADGQALRAVLLRGPQSGRLFGQGVDFTYVPRAGFEGTDGFTYKVWDGFAYSATASVTLVVEQGEPVRVEITEARWMDNGFELTVRATTGRAVRLEASEDLATWALLGVAANPNGTVRWVDPRSGERPERFYRAILEPSGNGL